MLDTLIAILHYHLQNTPSIAGGVIVLGVIGLFGFITHYGWTSRPARKERHLREAWPVEAITAPHSTATTSGMTFGLKRRTWAYVGKSSLLAAAVFAAYYTGLMVGRIESAQPVLQTTDRHQIRTAVALYVASHSVQLGEPTMVSARSAVVSVHRNWDTSDIGCDVLASKMLVPGSETLGVWFVSADKCSMSR
ncbi:hypothetical protein RAS12_30885 (plasmid) [Achromobacter seleniivolatilans]|uniref:Uncharacterized protein n=1 Tax=Achromobacter seleniivolatilans TaxID=3047478 RepID=A0ABY9MAZ8_9BURK|nr:hypothetical protein [Achromobacter sp. R39]WMD24040.1 hypothetical protein RAS12_30885 [Achromobacter sp. R39]